MKAAKFAAFLLSAVSSHFICIHENYGYAGGYNSLAAQKMVGTICVLPFLKARMLTDARCRSAKPLDKLYRLNDFKGLYPDSSCSAFVREGVLPLLRQIPNSYYPLKTMKFAMLSWLDKIRQGDQVVEICIDYQTDWDLFVHALDYSVPGWCSRRLVARNINELLRYEYYRKHGVQQHHALYDARANRYAFRERPSVCS